MSQCNLKVLTTYESGFVGIGRQCGLFHVSFNNILLHFTFREFQAFRKIARRLQTSNCFIPFPDNTDRLVLHTPYEGINFSFTTAEMADFVDALNEGHYMWEVHRLINDE